MTYEPSYLKASKRIEEQSKEPERLIKKAGSIALTATGALGAGSALSKVLPFFSKYLPQDMAMKGLNKVSPQLGKFVKNALSFGYGMDEVKNFIEQNDEKSQKAEESKNPIEMESPELHGFIQNEIKKGRTPIQAAAVASVDKNFKGIIDKLVKAHKTPWGRLIETLYGGALPNEQGSQPLNEDTLGIQMPNGQQAAPQQQSKQLSPKLQELMNTFTNINQSLEEMKRQGK